MLLTNSRNLKFANSLSLKQCKLLDGFQCLLRADLKRNLFKSVIIKKLLVSIFKILFKRYIKIHCIFKTTQQMYLFFWSSPRSISIT